MSVTATPARGDAGYLEPSDNPYTFYFSSNQSAQANFSFLVEARINTILDSQHYPIFPEVNGDTAHFDASEIISKSISPPPLNSTDFSWDAANNCAVELKIIERYGTPPTNQANTTAGQYAWKAAMHKVDFINYNFFDYEWNWPVSPRSEKPKFVSTVPRTSKYYCGMTEEVFLMFMSTMNDLDMVVSLYEADGTLIIEDAIATDCVNNNITMFNVSPRSISANSLIDTSDFDNCSYYECTLIDYEPNQESESFRIYIDRRCDHYGTKRMHFMDSFGSICSFSFTNPNETIRDIKHNSMEKQWGNFNSDNQYEYTLDQPTDVDFRNQSSGKMQIGTDWLPQTIQNWLAEEYCESPYVFLEVEGTPTLFRRIRVLDTQVKLENKKLDSPFRLVSSINLSDSRRTAGV